MNVVLIVLDQINAAHLGCAGHPVLRTPNIDRLAAEGAVMENAYCQAPLCMPSRASFNTGLDPHACRVRHNPVVLDEEFPTLAERLKAAGYRTGGFGHIGGDGVERGFESKVDLVDEPLRSAWMNEHCHVTRGGGKPAWYCGAHPLPAERTFDHLAAGLAIEFIRQSSCPFYLQLDFYGPHPPLVVPEPYASMYRPGQVVLPESWRDDLADRPSFMRATRVATCMEDVDEGRVRSALAHYYGKITFLDALVGGVIESLESRRLLDESLVIVTADHGDYAGEFGLIGKTGQFYDCLTHVPLIVRAPKLGVPAGRRTAAPVELVDLVPTVLDACGLDVPPALRGRSRLPLAQGRTEQGAEAVFAQTSGERGDQGGCARHWPIEKLVPLPSDPYSSGPACFPASGLMVRDGRHKLTLYADGFAELYDLADDPGERRNLAGEPSKAATVARLANLLLAWQMGTWPGEQPQQPLPYHWRASSIDSLRGRYRQIRQRWEQDRGLAGAADEPQ